jgi:excisionase family DNA binding protein
MESTEACLCPKEVAHMLGIGVRTARRRMAEGEVECYREGKLLRTTRAKVEAYIARKLEGLAPNGPPRERLRR